MVIEKFYLETERIPVFIGKEGTTKDMLEKKFNCSIEVDSKTGEVEVTCEEALNSFILSNIITAINHGHSPEHSVKLEDENIVFDIIDVKHKVHGGSQRLKSVMGRIIGKGGATRRAIEEITSCNISIKDHYVSVIGPYENVDLVHEALEMFIKGASHKALYQYLERNKVGSVSGLL